ncbi:MAG: AI-2E family transporter [Clostridia bacterium]|nr:AI-2E family transporter [Clostridia bacterium]
MKEFFKENKNKVILYALVAVIGVAAYFLFLKFDSFWNVVGFVASIFTPFFIGFCISYLINPLMRFIEQKALFWLDSKKNRNGYSKTRRLFSILITYVLMIGLVSALVVLLIPQIKTSVETLFRNIPDYIRVLSGNLTDWINYNHLDAQWMEELLPLNKLMEYATAVLNACFGWLVNIPMLVTTGFTNILVGIIVSVYFLYDKEKFAAASTKTIKALCKPKTAKRILDVSKMTDNTFSRFILGKIIDSAIIGVIAFPFMLLIYRPYALLISVIIGVTNVIPFFGPFIGAIPSALLILIVAPDRLLWFIIFVFVLQQFDGNILGPKILGETTGTSPILVLLGILAGSKLLGFLGMIVGVPFTAVLFILAKTYIDRKYQEKYENESDTCQTD